MIGPIDPVAIEFDGVVRSRTDPGRARYIDTCSSRIRWTGIERRDNYQRGIQCLRLEVEMAVDGQIAGMSMGKVGQLR